ncbi:hypothetical protein AQUCO_07600086v1 [Aquilegia coerulea]|uniref:Growth-regulating factor n=1 Tax=Aquilegia coerulea TaxID=218851 RepID=A0A2G5C8S3_AQUCA|nr:hypothetical protein AQUCO_07600086v1 [Aquilegia coerulea]
MMMSARNRNPFTVTQWQELEHQALIYKYMASGMPIPPDLIFPIKRSLDSSRFFPHQPMDWGCFQMGYGRKVDPEPGRCRRTDGKKWRCSKEAYPDSKYCERHMHRGRNRSRKPVEVNTTSNSSLPLSSFTSRTPSSTITSNTNPSSYSLSSSLTSDKSQQEHHHPYHNTPLHSFLNPSRTSCSSPRTHNIDFSPHSNNNANLVLDSGSYSNSYEDHRYVHGLKEEVDERAFFSEASGTLRSVPESTLKDPWRLTPLRMSSSTHNQPKDGNFSDLQRGYSQFQLQHKQQQQQQEEEQHCFILGTDFKSDRFMKTSTTTTEKEESQQPLRHFFDEWPPKSKDSWLGLEEDRSDQGSHSTTQLSISIPMSSHEFSVSNSRT